MRGFLHCATHDETVSGFGRNDAMGGDGSGSGYAFAALDFDVDVDEADGCRGYAGDAAGLA
jgi:hypothetical protein